MTGEILEKLQQITPEEQRILSGEKTIEKEIYMEENSNVIDATKLLEAGKLIQVRTHTRFIHFPEHTHNYVEMIYMCSGSTHHVINGEDVILKQGELLILNQNAVQEIYPAGEGDVAVNFIILPEFFDYGLKMIETEENQLRDFIVDCLRGENHSAGYLHFKVAEGFRQQFLQDVCAEALEKRDSMYRITRAVNMLSDFTQFHVIFRQYCTPSTDFSEELHDLFSEFLKAEEHRHFSESTMKQLRGRLMRFHDYLYDIGIRDFKSVTGSIINTYILSLARYSTTYVSESLREIRRLLTFGYENGFIDTPLSDFIPHVKNIRQQKIPSTFTDTEIEKILNSVDRSNPIGKRNYAIFLIAARLGIRSSDIRTLTFSNINWDDKLISFCQQKTGHALSLPLPDDVGWAIIDYLKNGRPETNVKNIFVSHMYPYGELHSLGNVIPRQMRTAGINTPANKRTGMHAFRHGLATRMLENDVSLPVISQTLGHADISSTEVYLRISIKQLALCGLEVDL